MIVLSARAIETITIPPPFQSCFLDKCVDSKNNSRTAIHLSPCVLSKNRL
jgi:hypothetical protein